MSRSYRHRPFWACCGSTKSAKRDKQMAHRAERRTVNREIHKSLNTDYEDFLAPLRRECSHNNTYTWNRDGKQIYQGLGPREWFHHHQEIFKETEWSRYMSEDTWPPAYYTQMMRK